MFQPWHAIPAALIQIVADRIKQGDSSQIEFVSAGGNIMLAVPVVVDGRIVRVEFKTKVPD